MILCKEIKASMKHAASSFKVEFCGFKYGHQYVGKQQEAGNETQGHGVKKSKTTSYHIREDLNLNHLHYESLKLR
jgi:hypothetical protein